MKKCSKQREKGDKTPSEKSPAAPKASKSVSNTSSETNRDSQSSFSAPSLFEGELTDNSSDVDENRSLNNIQIELDQKEIVFQNETKLTISMKPLKMDLTDWYQPEPATKEELAMFETTPDLNESSCWFNFKRIKFIYENLEIFYMYLIYIRITMKLLLKFMLIFLEKLIFQFEFGRSSPFIFTAACELYNRIIMRFLLASRLNLLTWLFIQRFCLQSEKKN